MIEPEEIAKLAEFYDQYANALDRKSPDRAAARRQFLARLKSFYQQNAALRPLTFAAKSRPRVYTARRAPPAGKVLGSPA